MRHKKKKAKKYAQERGPPGLEDPAVWRNFIPPLISKTIWEAYIQHVKAFRMAVTVQCGELEHGDWFNY